MSYSIAPIGFIRCAFKQRLIIPRQPQLAPAARAVLELLPPFNAPCALEGLQKVSHVWLLFLFHQSLKDETHLRVRPPRLGGQKKIGVFASRAPQRPNGIGQSLVKLERIEAGRLYLSAIDLLDGTPVVDIKPYLPWADCPSEPVYNHLASSAPKAIAVEWTAVALAQAKAHALRLTEPVVELIEQCLAQDPRPAWQKPLSTQRYGVRLWDLEVRWHYPEAELICVLEVVFPTPAPADADGGGSHD